MARPYFERTPEGLVLQADPADAVRQGLLRAIVLPVLLVLLTVLLALFVCDATPGALSVAVLATLPFSFAACVWGVLQVAFAKRNALRSRVVWRDGALHTADGRSIPKSAVASVVADQPNKALAARAIRFVGADGKPTVVLGSLPQGRGPDIAAAAEALAAEVGVSVDAAGVRNASAFGVDGPNYAALCYMPFQGIGLGISLLALQVSRDPLVRFSAKQSLLWFVASTVAVVGAGVVLGVPMMFLPDAVVEVGVVLLIVVVSALLMLRIGVSVYAGWKAWNGVAWLIPGLSVITRRWLPETVAQEPKVDAGVWAPPLEG